MNKEETIKILELLNAFYAGGKNDPKQQVVAWYLILEKYDFITATEAVLRFAENDTREYAAFPAVGLIVNEIRKLDKEKHKAVEEIIGAIGYGREYESISEQAKLLINEPSYNEWLNVDAEEFATTRATELRQSLKRRQGLLT